MVKVSFGNMVRVGVPVRVYIISFSRSAAKT